MSADIIQLPARVAPEPSGNGAREALAEVLAIYGYPEGIADALLALLWGAGFKIVPIDD